MLIEELRKRGIKLKITHDGISELGQVGIIAKKCFSSDIPNPETNYDSSVIFYHPRRKYRIWK